jgi:hypothetical protein
VQDKIIWTFDLIEDLQNLSSIVNL